MSPMFNRNFFLLWQGQFVSQVGNQAYLVALMFWLLERTGSVSLMGLLLMTSSLPGVLLGPLAGAFVDRHSRKTIIVGTDVVRGVAMAVLTAVTVVSDSTELIIAVLFVVAVLNGIAAAMFNPAVGAAIPDLVPPETLRSANSLNQMSVQAASFIGLAAGGAAYAWFGPVALFAVNATSFLLSGLSEAFIQIPRRGPTAIRNGFAGYVRDMRNGWAFVAERRGMLIFIGEAAAINFLFMPIFVLLPFFITEVLGKGPEWYGLALAAMSAGSLLGLVTVAWFRYAEHPSFVAISLIGVAVLMWLLGMVRHSSTLVATMVGLGFLTAQVNILVFTFLQIRTPQEFRGRVMALVMTLTGVATPIGLGAGSIIIDLTGRHVVATYLILGSTAIAVTVLGSSSLSFRTFLAGSKHSA